MSNDLANNKAQVQHDAVTDQACKVFEETSVCAVSAILSNDSKHRKIVRSVVFLLFTVTFLYQCIAFLCYVLQYPTVVDFEASRENEFLGPAYTFCNVNPTKRSKFCAKFPRNCTKPDKEFCEKYPRFCGTPDTLILKDDDFEIDSLDEFFLLNYDAEDMIGVGRHEDDEPVGPFPRLHKIEKLIGACYTFYDRVDSPLDPFMKRRTPRGTGFEYTVEFDPQENEVIHPDTKAGIMFEVHSPFEPVNPFETGDLLRPGYFYSITVKISQEELLPHECVNYTDVWLKNNKTGYRSQVACREKCMGDIILKCINCTEPRILYPYPNETICTYPDNMRLSGMCAHPEEEGIECMRKCKDDCIKTKFSSEVHESFRNRYARLAERNESRTIMVNIEFPQTDVPIIIHKPQFQVLEIFSLIGGLLAFWIGLSMFQVVEVFDCVLQIVKCLVKKRSPGSESSTA